MAAKASFLLKQLEQLKETYGGDAALQKLALLKTLEKAALVRAGEVFRLHEVLCFLKAYPDNQEVLDRVEHMLNRFAHRKDLRKHRRALVNSGIAGTLISYPFYWFTALWLAGRLPGNLSINWANFEKKNKLEDFLHLLLPYCETLSLDYLSFNTRDWIEELKGPGETDAAFLIRRFQAVTASSFGRETFFERFDIPIKLAPGPDTPSRTRERYRASPVVFQTGPLQRGRPSLRREIKGHPERVQSLPQREAREVIALAREAMITRSRDLDVFEHASCKDVQLVDFGGGLQFACMGVIPERRLMLEAVYGFLTLKNGIPIGYVLVGALFDTVEAAFNMFDTFRAAESAFIYSRVLAMSRHLFGCDAIVVPPVQLGHNNPEGLKSGAWWFYYKLGFRPQSRRVRRILRAELEKMKRNPRHRSTTATLNKLASENMYFYLKRPRQDILGEISLGSVGLQITRTLAERFGADREAAVKACTRDAARLLGVRSFRGFSAGEKLAWQRWSPLILSLPGVEKWNVEDKQALVQVVRAKGGERESRFVQLFNRHRRLRNAILKLSWKA